MYACYRSVRDIGRASCVLRPSIIWRCSTVTHLPLKTFEELVDCNDNLRRAKLRLCLLLLVLLLLLLLLLLLILHENIFASRVIGSRALHRPKETARSLNHRQRAVVQQ
jgi:hypothetical protein